MKTIKRLIIFLGIVLVIVGGVLMAFAIKNNAFRKEELVENTYDIDGEFENIKIYVGTDDVEFKLATDGKNRLECKEFKDVTHTVKVEDNQLTISDTNHTDNTPWYDKIFKFNWETPKAVLYLTNNIYNEFQAEGSTGMITVGEDFEFKNANIVMSTGIIRFSAKINSNIYAKVSTGLMNIKNLGNCNEATFEASTGQTALSDFNCKTLNVKASTGDIVLNNVISEGGMTVNASTGNVRLNDVDAETIYVKVSTGNIKGTILTPKTFNASTSTGKVNVPSGTTGGECTLITTTGNINVIIKAE